MLIQTLLLFSLQSQCFFQPLNLFSLLVIDDAIRFRFLRLFAQNLSRWERFSSGKRRPGRTEMWFARDVQAPDRFTAEVIFDGGISPEIHLSVRPAISYKMEEYVIPVYAEALDPGDFSRDRPPSPPFDTRCRSLRGRIRSTPR